MDASDDGWQIARSKKSMLARVIPSTTSKNEKKMKPNRYTALATPDSFDFTNLPAELRLQTYGLLLNAVEAARTHQDTPGWQGTVSSASQTKAAGMYSNFLLVNRQLYYEIQAANCSDDWTFTAYNTLAGPRTPQDANGRERAILANARSWTLEGYTAGGTPGGRADYSVQVILRREGGQRYRLVWMEMDAGVRQALGISDRMNEAMVSRVERALGVAVAAGEEAYGVQSLTVEGVIKVIDAFYFDGREV